MKLRALYNYDVDAASLEAGQANNEPSMTDQSFAEECDINTIVRRFGLTGEMPQQVVVPTYADFERTYDYHSAMIEIRRSEEEFMKLPGDVRARFDHDPGKLVEFLNDDANRSEAEALGLVARSATKPEAERGVPPGA